MTDDPTEQHTISSLGETIPNVRKAEELIAAVEKHPMGRSFMDLQVGLSVSDSPDLAGRGFGKAHLEDAFVEISRHLLANGASLVYGGDLRPGGYTELLFGLALLYRLPKQNRIRVRNYEAWPIHLGLEDAYQIRYSEQVEFVKVEPPAELTENRQQFFPPDTASRRFIWARSLTKMREQMNDVTTARIFMGGQTHNYKGAYPGLLEEVLLALRKQQPIYLIGAFGGVTERIINVITRHDTEAVNYWVDSRTPDEAAFRLYFNNQCPTSPIDFSTQSAQLLTYDLDHLSKTNFLSAEENLRLFKTPHLFEIVHLVLRGLSRYVKSHG